MAVEPILEDALLDSVMAAEMQEAEDTSQAMTLSLNAISGTSKNKTMRVRAIIGNQVMLMLIDSGSSHSFVDQDLAARVGALQFSIAPVAVKVANGQNMPCTTKIPNMTWLMGCDTFSHDMHVLPLGTYDAVLGIDWLELWGDMRCNWKEQWLEIDHNGSTVRLQGVTDTTPSTLHAISVHQLAKSVKGNDVWALALLERTLTNRWRCNQFWRSIRMSLTNLTLYLHVVFSIIPSI